jgi:hypothetical protein
VGRAGVAIAAFLFLVLATSIVQAQDGTAKLKILGGEPGAVVRVNGEYVDSLPMKHAASVQAGTLFVEIEADGFRTYRETVDVLPRTRKRLRVNLVPEDQLPPTAAAAEYAAAGYGYQNPTEEPVDHFGMHTVSIFDLKRSLSASRASDPVPPPPAPPAAVQPATVAPAKAAVALPARPAATAPVRAPISTGSGGAKARPAPRLSRSSAAGEASQQKPAGGAAAGASAVGQPLLPEDAATGAGAYADTGSGSRAGVSQAEGSELEEGEDYPGERESEGPDDFDPFNIDIFAGYSYLFMVLGHEEPPTAEEAQNMSQQEIDRLANATPADLVDTVQGPGVRTGAAAWLRYNPVWLGLRFAYATYDPASVLTLMGELGMRFQGSVAEVFFGFGLGSGWLYGVSPARINADSGLALKFGLGLNFFVARDVAFGLSLDAVGLFLAGEGISPGQIGNFDPESSNHPIGIQLPIMLNLGLRT